MPFYEYECRQCGAQTEVMQKISDKPLKKCPKCGKSALVRLISAPVFRLKGGGWYETDFKTDQDRKRNLADSSGESADAGGSTPGGAAKESADKGTSGKDSSAASGGGAGAESGAAAPAKAVGGTAVKEKTSTPKRATGKPVAAKPAAAKRAVSKGTARPAAGRKGRLRG